MTVEGFEDLKALVKQGVYVKATGFGRIEVEPIAAIKELIDINPDAIMFGTDLPSTRAKRPFSEQDIELTQKHFDEETQEKIFYKNALKFYKFQNENRICSSGKRIYKLSIIFIMRFDISLNKNIIKLYPNVYSY